MLRKAHKQQRQSIDKIYTQECGSLLPRGTGPFGYAFHSPHATDIRSEIQKATASPQMPMSDLLQVAYSVFDNRDMVEKAELSQRNTQRADDDCSFVHSETSRGEVSLCRPSWPWWTTWPTGAQTNPGCPVWTEGRWRRDCGRLALLQTAREQEEGMPQTPEIHGAPWSWMVSQH